MALEEPTTEQCTLDVCFQSEHDQRIIWGWARRRNETWERLGQQRLLNVYHEAEFNINLFDLSQKEQPMEVWIRGRKGLFGTDPFETEKLLLTPGMEMSSGQQVVPMSRGCNLKGTWISFDTEVLGVADKGHYYFEVNIKILESGFTYSTRDPEMIVGPPFND